MPEHEHAKRGRMQRDVEKIKKKKEKGKGYGYRNGNDLRRPASYGYGDYPSGESQAIGLSPDCYGICTIGS